MDQANLQRVPFVKSVFYATDFSENSGNAFVHALAISVLRQTKLTILHAGKKFTEDHEWTQFPSVRETLERWGALPQGSSKDAVASLGVNVQKVEAEGGNALKACTDYLEQYPTDLLVLGTRGSEGLPKWIAPSKAEKISEKTKTMTLFIPQGTKGFISAANGEITIRRILIPVDKTPNPMAALEYATRVAVIMDEFKDEPVEILLLHVTDTEQIPATPVKEDPRWIFKNEKRKGNVVEQIVKSATENEVDLIMMATRGHDGAFDALRGSTTEQVLRKAPCPLLAIPEKRILNLWEMAKKDLA